MNLPLGYLFLPTDEELISSYLLKRVMELPLPCHVILERELYGQNTAPCDVFRDIDESNSWYWQPDPHETKRVTKKTIYVFTKLVKVGANSSRISRRAGSGTWSGQTGARMIKNFNGETIGSRKMFTFEDSTANDDGYHWIMQEYSLDGVYKNLGINNNNNDLVLCKITRSFKGKPTTNTENNGSRLDHTKQPVPTIENNGNCLDHTPQQVATIENNGGLPDQIPQVLAATIENNGDGYSLPSACNNGGRVDQIPPSAATIKNNGDGYFFSSACINGGHVQNPQSMAAPIENNGDGYSYPSAWINYGGGVDQIQQSAVSIENTIEAPAWSSMSGSKRSWDEDTGVPLPEDCEEQINPKKPRILSSSSRDDDNYATFLEEQPLADLESNNTDDLLEELPDFESLEWLVDYETNVV